ncbi:MAG: DNA-processing protein DprA [Geminicoccaceae bacterium]
MAETLTLTERLDWLQLARSAGVGPKTFYRLLHRFGSARRAFEELPRLSAESDGRERRRCRRDEAEAELDGLSALDAHIIAHGEPSYPRLLGEIHDPPPLLTVRGELDVLHGQTVAIVGARNASANGRLLANMLAKDLAAGGLVVVSGLARGIDTAAHEGAIAAGGRTVAVIASGVDIAYPADNAGLMDRIAETGAIVSERPLGCAPQARHFPRRNRLISGLSSGVVVVEAAPKSGSLITARMAIEQNREVMAVPGSPLDPRHRGTNQLLREGAVLIETADDVRQALGEITVAPRQARPRPDVAHAMPPSVDCDRIDRMPISASGAPSTIAPPAESAPHRPVPDHIAESLLDKICERLGTEPLLVDELIRQCHANSSEMQHALFELELEGRIERHPGNRVSLASS